LVTNGKLPAARPRPGDLTSSTRHPPNRADIAIHQMPLSAADYGAKLFEVLYHADAGKLRLDRSGSPAQHATVGKAIQDRLKRAATK